MKFIKKILLIQLLLMCGSNFLSAQVVLSEHQIMPMIMRGVDIIDVRADNEYQKSSIVNAIHIPINQLEEKSSDFEKGKEYIISASSNAECNKAIEKLQALGFEKVYNGSKWTIIQPKNISGNLSDLLKKEALILDVRTLEEFETEHLPNALHIPIGELTERIGELDKEKVYITCCSHGLRSIRAVNTLVDNGFKKVYNGGSWLNLKKY